MMLSTFSDTLLISKAALSPISSGLLVLLGSVFLAWYVQYLWSRRYFYYYSFKTPGPLSLPLIGNALNFLGKASEIPQRFTSRSKQYNGIWTMWLGPRPFYMISDFKYLQTVFTHPNALNKELSYRFLQPGTGESLFSTFSISKWKVHRKIISPSFNEKILEQFHKIFVEQSELMNIVVEKYAGKGAFKLSNYIDRCMLDIITESAMGVKLNSLTSKEPLEFCHLVERCFTILMVRIFNVFWHPDFIFNNLRQGKFIKTSLPKVRKFVQEVVQRRRIEFEKSFRFQQDNGVLPNWPRGYDPCLKSFSSSNPKCPKIMAMVFMGIGTKRKMAFLDSLLETIHQENQHWTESELIDEVILFIIAGYDTTATALSSTLMALGMFPDVQEKVYKEVIEHIGPHRKVTYSDVAKLQYCERVLKEALRLFSSVIIGRYADDDVCLDEKYTIPKGSAILADLWTAGRDPAYWKDPLTFNPDRFSPGNVDNPGQLLTFSLGPRNCLGKRYAMLEMKTFLATFIRKYRTRCEYKNVTDVEMKMSGVMKPVGGYKTSIEKRNV